MFKYVHQSFCYDQDFTGLPRKGTLYSAVTVFFFLKAFYCKKKSRKLYFSQTSKVVTCFFFLDILYQRYARTVSVQYMPSFLSLYIYWYRRSAKNRGTGIPCGYMKKFLILNFNEGHEIPVHLRPILHFVITWFFLAFSCCNKINYYFVAVEFVLCLDQNRINF